MKRQTSNSVVLHSLVARRLRIQTVHTNRQEKKSICFVWKHNRETWTDTYCKHIPEHRWCCCTCTKEQKTTSNWRPWTHTRPYGLLFKRLSYWDSQHDTSCREKKNQCCHSIRTTHKQLTWQSDSKWLLRDTPQTRVTWNPDIFFVSSSLGHEKAMKQCQFHPLH